MSKEHLQYEILSFVSKISNKKNLDIKKVISWVGDINISVKNPKCPKCHAFVKEGVQCSRTKSFGNFCGLHRNRQKYGVIPNILTQFKLNTLSTFRQKISSKEISTINYSQIDTFEYNEICIPKFIPTIINGFRYYRCIEDNCIYSKYIDGYKKVL